MIARILVVCEGNVCRSPMGEALFRAHGKTAASAGINALVGAAPPEHARSAMRAYGIDIGAHRGRSITNALCVESDLILVMDNGQRRNLESLCPTARGKIFRLCEHANVDVVDPWRQPRSAFDACAKVVESGVKDWLAHLASL